MQSASNEIRRARPLLGTFVEIAAAGVPAAAANAAIEAAFAAVQQVDELMSFHNPHSDVSQLNRFAARRCVPVHPLTWEVLAAARHIATATREAFDITVAPVLQDWGYLPRRGRCPGARAGHMRAIELLPGCKVRFHQPLRVDLGGIAKGFAVDRAVAKLQAGGCSSGRVNAGGDLRVFGPVPPVVHVRHPGVLNESIPLALPANSAFATSAPYFARKKLGSRWVSPLIDTAQNRAFTAPVSLSIQAPTCMMADALTKALLGWPTVAPSLLQQFSASAYIVTDAGAVFSTNQPYAP